MKKLLAIAGYLLSFSCFAAIASNDLAIAPNCPIADPHSPSFCSDFKSAAKCYCDTIFPGRCPGNMNALFDLMMAGHKNLDDACRFQEPITHLPKSICVDHWNAFHNQHCAP